jgi:sugar phosphate isomerase/epimerase
MPLPEARRHIADGIAACVDHAKAVGVRLAIEPLHPCYAGDRSAINTMAQARRICEQFDLDAPAHPATPGACARKLVGIAADVFHIWWDEALEDEIAIAGAKGYLHAFHVCDWKTNPADLLNDRGIMGEGVIDIPRIRGWVERAGFTGFNEIEIFSAARWAGDQQAFLDACLAAYRARV